MYGYGAMPMIPPMPVFTPMPMLNYHHHCCSPVNNFMSMYTTMALFNNVFENTLSLFNYQKPVEVAKNNNINPFEIYNFTKPAFYTYNSIPFVPVTIPPITNELPSFIKVNKFNTKTNSVTKTPNKVVTARKPSTTTSIVDVAKIYDPEKGKKLAQATINGLSSADKGYCARAVKTAIQNTGLGAYESGHANAMPSILRRNGNFKEVKVAPSDLDKLPAGCVLCYAPGDCGYDAEAGHTEVTDGNGNAFHFAQTCNIRQSDNVRVFVPV